MTSPHSVRARAFSSFANVGYGFDVFGVCIDAGSDVVEVARGGAGLELSVDGLAGDSIPSDPLANTAGRAIDAVRQSAGVSDPLRIRVIKGTRSGSGLGSSAASAAAAVTAVDALLGLRLPIEQRVLLAAEGERAAAGAAHTDNVAAAIYGGFVVFSNERPPLVAQVDPPAGLRFVIALPRIQVTTKTARQVLPAQVTVAEYSRGCARAALSALHLARGDLRAFGPAIEGAFFEQCRAPLIPGFVPACDAARQAGAYGVVMSGAGPAVAAVCEAQSDVERIAAALRSGFASAGVAADTLVASVAAGAHVIKDAD